MKRNYQRELEGVIDGALGKGSRPSVLLHACCAPCSSYVLEYLVQFFEVFLFFFNPNISPAQEYDKRLEELEGLLDRMGLHEVSLLKGEYRPEVFAALAEGLEELPEGGERCFGCFGLRLFETAKRAVLGGFDYFATTLSISPHKNADKLNEIGEAAGRQFGVAWLPADFKKKNGYKRSIELSGEYDLYRQNYCGCLYSKAAADRRTLN